MKYIIADDEPIARRGIEKLARQIVPLELVGSFENADAAGGFMENNQVDMWQAEKQQTYRIANVHARAYCILSESCCPIKI